MFRLCPLAIVLCLVGSVPALAQPTISQVTPLAVAPGATVELTIVGDKFAPPLQVWSSFPAKIEATPVDEKNLKCKVTLEGNVPVGVGGLVVANAAGASDPLYLLIDDLPTIADNGANHTIEQAQAVAIPAAVDGTSDGSVFDFYKFAVKAGQRVSVEVVASRMASTFDPVVRLLDAKGNELLLADDDPAIGADCRLAHVFGADGDYILEIHDNKYAAGGRYRLRVGDFPLVTAPMPLGGRLGSTCRFNFAGPMAEGTESLIVSIANQAPLGGVGLSAKFPQGKSSGMCRAVVSQLPEAMEVEPNDTASQATAVMAPCAVSGVLGKEGDRDFFEVLAIKGQRLTFRAVSRSVGSPAIPYMQLQKADGASIGETAVTANEEETLSVVVPETGSYRLLVEDLLKRSGPSYAYRVEIETGGGFSLSLKPDPKAVNKFVTPIGDGAFALDLVVARNGYTGPIQLSLENAPGFRLHGDEIPANGAAARLMVVASAEVPPGSFHAIRVVGRANVDGRDVTSAVSTLALNRTKAPQNPYPPAWADGLFAVAAAPAAEPFFATSPDKPTLFFPRMVGQSLVTVKLERKHKDFKAPISLTPISLPAGFAAAIKQENDNYVVTLTGPKEAPEGKLTIRLLGFAEMGRGQIVYQDIPVEVVTPLAVAVQPAGPIAAGQKQKVKIVATRKGEDRQPISVKFVKLPAGVSATEAMIPADKDELEVELAAGADAAAGKFDQLTIEATTKYAGQDLKVANTPAVLEVVK